MIQQISLRVWAYLFECIRLLYWVSCKPSTFRRIVEEAFEASLLDNRRLSRLLLRLGIISIFGSLIFVLVMSIVYHMMPGGLFDWLDSGGFLVAWGVMLQFTLSFGQRRTWKELVKGGIIRISGLALLFVLVFLLISQDVEQVKYIAFSMASGLALGLLLGLTLDLILILAEDLLPVSHKVYILVSGWSICQIVGLTYSLIFGLTINWQTLVSALTISLIGGLAYALGGCLSWGLVFILGRGRQSKGRRWIRGLAETIVCVMLGGLINSVAMGMFSGLLQSLPASLAGIVTLYWAAAGLSIDKTIHLIFSYPSFFLILLAWVLSLIVSLIWCLAVGGSFGLLASVGVGLAWSLLLGRGCGWTVGVTSALGGLIGAFRLCFWIPECLWMFVLSSSLKRSSSSTAAYWLHRLPPYWDELIFLPLPFLARFIVRAAQKDPDAAQQTIEYLMTSPRQKRVATQAMFDIVAPLLARCQTPNDIGAIGNQLSWVSNLSTQGTNVFLLAQFIEVSQQVHMVLPTHLNIPLTSLHTLRAEIAQGKPTKQTSSFRAISQQWLTILEAGEGM